VKKKESGAPDGEHLKGKTLKMRNNSKRPYPLKSMK
jgi:hypothetical protein